MYNGDDDESFDDEVQFASSEKMGAEEQWGPSKSKMRQHHEYERAMKRMTKSRAFNQP
jgi:hypothetical protein